MKSGKVFITGAGGFIGSRLAEQIWRQQRQLVLLARPGSRSRLEKKLARFGVDPTERLEIVEGDIERPHLGLDSKVLDRLAGEVTDVFHVAAVYRLDIDEEQAQRTNVEGTRNVIEFCRELPRLLRLNHVSTLAVAGDFQGHYKEFDFDVGQGFDHAYGLSKFRSEALVRQASKSLPVTVYRPGIVVGDSRTGSIDKIDGPYYAIALLLKLRSLPGARRMPMIVPREEGIYFHIVPVDYVVRAMVELSGLDQAAGKTFHLMDPEPPTFSQFYNQVLGLMGFEGRRFSRPLTRTIKLLLRGPSSILRRSMSALGMPAELLAHLTYRITYDTSEARQLLLPRDVVCPRYETYLPKLVAFLEQHPGTFGL